MSVDHVGRLDACSHNPASAETGLRAIRDIMCRILPRAAGRYCNSAMSIPLNIGIDTAVEITTVVAVDATIA
ncbi:MAG: hypothetical protein U5O39_04740 [Gammaproteobacteria bacterium]|nr:hypothetical protein [Gammaproteobacteria bacterium]